MFPCSQCPRTYTNRSSLSRHSHVHKGIQKHSCSICRTSFHRRDLLLRHLKVHQSADEFVQENSSLLEAVGAEDRRRRCHTACIRCRDLRTKCNGKFPCLSCYKSEATCEFPVESRRLSRRNLEKDVAYSSSASQHTELAMSVQGVLESSCILEGTTKEPRPSMNTHELTQQSIDPQSTPFSYNDYSAAVEGLHSDAVVLGLLQDHSTIDPMTWPWVHESLFLSMDPAAAPSLLGMGPEDAQNVLSSYSLSEMGDIPHDFQATFEQLGDHAGPEKGGGAHSIAQGGATNVPDFGSSSIFDEISSSKEAQLQLVQQLVLFASKFNSHRRESDHHTGVWEAWSNKVVNTFAIAVDTESSSSKTLHYFGQKYMEHFGVLWPLLSSQNLRFEALNPALFLVLTSIGAMYCGQSGSTYGTMMHSELRRNLSTAVELEDEDIDLIPLGQSRLLIQVAALYFGQPKAFTYAQHLGGILVTQARRMGLFSSRFMDLTIHKFHSMKSRSSDEDRFLFWTRLEMRRRLAFGIFRADTYTSVLLHTKPLVSLEEIDLCLPTCEVVWRGEGMAANVCLHMIENDQTPGRELRASDIYRITLDQHETLPPLTPAGHELLMFALQYQVWRFSHDWAGFDRSAGVNDILLRCSNPASSPKAASISPESILPSELAVKQRSSSILSSSSEVNFLDSSVRKMSDTQQEVQRLLCAMEKWQRALPVVKSFVHTGEDRSSLLSGLILYHGGILRLHAPLEDLHQLQYRIVDGRPLDEQLVQSTRRWANSVQGRLAAERACSIWSIIAREAHMPVENRVKFNLLSFIYLHHGAVLLWAYTGAREDEEAGDDQFPMLTGGQNAVPVERDSIKEILSSFCELYNCISPAPWSSFAMATKALSSHQFPQSPVTI